MWNRSYRRLIREWQYAAIALAVIVAALFSIGQRMWALVAG